MAVYRLFTNSDGAVVQWTKLGAAAHHWEEVRKTGSLDPVIPSTATGLKVPTSATSATDTFDVDALTLAAGEVVTGCTIHIYAKGTNSAVLQWGVEGSGANSKGEELPSLRTFFESNVAGWKSLAYSAELAKRIDNKILEKWASEAFAGFFITKTKGTAEVIAYSLYVEITTELTEPVFSGAISQTIGFQQVVSGRKIASGPVSQQVAVQSRATGVKTAVGSVRQQLALRTSAQGIKTAVGSVAQRLGLSQSTSGRKIARGSVSSQVAFSTPVSGFKRVAGSVVSVVAFVQEWLSNRKPGNASSQVIVHNDARAAVIVHNHATTEIRVLDDADADVSA